MTDYAKYKVNSPIEIEDRCWPSRRIIRAPMWCPVDLRDGNQAFAKPMDVETKIKYFKMLTAIGFKDIEVAYPSASAEEFEFVRRLIEDDIIPDDVIISVFTAAREKLIEKTIESIKGCSRASIHCYMATSELHNRFVFRKTEKEVMNTIVNATRFIRESVEAAGMRDKIRYQFSPEEFSDSRVGFIVDIATAVEESWRSRGKDDFIFNLPATVERKPPYEFADMVETFVRRYPGMNVTTLSTHTHNDQGGAVLAAEMAMLAGVERVEGTLCGHGERTGNMDIITFALNLKSRGIDPGLDLSNVMRVADFIEEVSNINIHPRAPYIGELVFTAFSGTHQDAISKGMAQREEINRHFEQGWKMPYLHIDPMDIGRDYSGLIRINSQSGKGGIAYVLESVYGISVPKVMQADVAAEVQKIADKEKNELFAEQIYSTFRSSFIDIRGHLEIVDVMTHSGEGKTEVQAIIRYKDEEFQVNGIGHGPIEALIMALRSCSILPGMKVHMYSEHALGHGSDAEAIAFVGMEFMENGTIVYGAGIDCNIDIAATKAITAAINKNTTP